MTQDPQVDNFDEEEEIDFSGKVTGGIFAIAGNIKRDQVQKGMCANVFIL